MNDAAGLPPFDPARFPYRAFISYSRRDAAIASSLHSSLTRFRTPRVLQTRTSSFGNLPPARVRVFLDVKGAEAGGGVEDLLNAKLAQSAFLIVLCSPASRHSVWVNEEIRRFAELASPRRILPVFLRESTATPLEDLAPPALADMDGGMPIGPDLALDGGIIAIRDKLLGGMLGFAQDEIALEQQRADRKARDRRRVAAAAVGTLATGVAVLFAMFMNESAERKKTWNALSGSMEEQLAGNARFVAEGRMTRDDAVRLAEVAGAPAIERTLSEMAQSADAKYTAAQLYQRYAVILDDAKRSDESLRYSREAYRLALGFKSDIGADAPTVICSAALTYSSALFEAGDLSARGPLDECERVAAAELDNAVAEISPTHAELSRILLDAQVSLAELDLAEGRFGVAFNRYDEIFNEIGAGKKWGDVGRNWLPISVRATVSKSIANLMLGRYSEAQSLAVQAIDILDSEALGIDAFGATLTAIDAAGRVEGGLPSAIERAKQLEQILAKTLQTDSSFRFLAERLVRVRLKLAELSFEANQDGEADAWFARADEWLTQLTGFDPARPDWRELNATRWNALGVVRFRRSETHASDGAKPDGNEEQRLLGLAREAFEASLRSLDDTGESANGALLRFNALVYLSRTLRTAGDLPGALASLEKAAAVRKQSGALEGETPSALIARSGLADEQADLAMAENKYEKAAKLFNNAISLADNVMLREPLWIDGARNVVWDLYRLSKAYLANDKADGARAALARACSILAEKHPSDSALFNRDAVKVRSLALDLGVGCPTEP